MQQLTQLYNKIYPGLRELILKPTMNMSIDTWLSHVEEKQKAHRNRIAAEPNSSQSLNDMMLMNKLPVETVSGENGPAPGLAIDVVYFLSGHEVEPALVRAARLGHTGIIQRLLVHIAINKASSGDLHLDRAMFYASLYGYTDIMELLEDHGVPLDQPLPGPGVERSPPMELAFYSGNEKTIRWVLQRTSFKLDDKYIFAAVAGYQIIALRMIVKNASSATLSVVDSEHLLWEAINLRNYDAVSYLLEEAKVGRRSRGFRHRPELLGCFTRSLRLCWSPCSLRDTTTGCNVA